jgi:hypothetical protein
MSPRGVTTSRFIQFLCVPTSMEKSLISWQQILLRLKLNAAIATGEDSEVFKRPEKQINQAK